MIIIVAIILSLITLTLGGLLLFRGVDIEMRLAALSARLLAVAAHEHERAPTAIGFTAWMERIGSKLVTPKEARGPLGAELRAAGFFDQKAVPIFAAVRLGLTILTAVVVLAVGFADRTLVAQDYATAFAAAVVVFVLSRQWLKARAKSRAMVLTREFAFVLDLFVLSFESGLSLDQAVRHVTGAANRPAPESARTLERLIMELDSGAPYEEALKRWGDRVNLEESKDLAGLFRQSLTHGSELAPAIRRYREEIADKRISKAREEVGRKTAQLTVVMIVFFMPALLMVIAGPAMVGVGRAFLN
ncbi:MAG: type II secretion system F family protein [Alphaproteobacteria bacterium]